MRFYKYLIYRIYSWRIEKKDNTPVASVEMIMCILHFLQIVTLYAILTYFFPQLSTNLSSWHVLAFAIIFQIIYHFVVYSKDKWLSYVERFKNENQEERKKGTKHIVIYAIATLVLFFTCLPLFA